MKLKPGPHIVSSTELFCTSFPASLWFIWLLIQETESVATSNSLTYPSSDVAATLEESGDQQTLVTLAFSEKADAAIRQSGASNSGELSLLSLERDFSRK